MANFFKDNDDLRFYVEEWIDWDPLVRLTEQDFTDEYGFANTEEAVGFYRDVLEMIGRFVAEEVDPKVAVVDRDHPELVDGEVELPAEMDEIFDKIEGLDIHGMCVPRELGGINAPLMLYMLMTEMFGKADVSIAAHHGFHGGIAMALLVYSVMEGSADFDDNGRIIGTRFDEAISEIISGEAWGSMDITEPGAGSDMGAIRTKGEQDDEGNWFVTGQKIFITSGHGKYHIVIARTEPDEEGDQAFDSLKKLSTFLVKAYDEDAEGRRTRYVTVDRLEEKMGHHASPTCAVSFERSPAILIGERGEGFKHMLLLMNNARIGVAFESIGLCEKALELARDYAAERESMGKTIDRHEMIADYLDEMAVDIKGMRAMAMESAYWEELSQKQEIMATRAEAMGDEVEARRLTRKAKRNKWKARRLTPLLKYIAAEKAVEMARRSLQIHGGAGYTTEYGAEKLLRDAVVMPIYEGTSQIQALMAMKDALGRIMKNPQSFVRDVAQARWRSVSARDPLERRLARMQSIALATQQHLVTRTAVDKFKSISQLPVTEWAGELTGEWNPKRDFAHAMLHAERLTQILADVAIAELLYDQQRDYPERRALAEAHMERAEPRCRYLQDVITSTGDRLLDELHPGSKGDITAVSDVAE